jgi:hypothetical protein
MLSMAATSGPSTVSTATPLGVGVAVGVGVGDGVGLRVGVGVGVGFELEMGVGVGVAPPLPVPPGGVTLPPPPPPPQAARTLSAPSATSDPVNRKAFMCETSSCERVKSGTSYREEKTPSVERSVGCRGKIARRTLGRLHY